MTSESRSLADQLGSALRRRRKQILLVFAVAFAASAAVILKLKPSYKASAVIVVDESMLPAEYVRPTVTGEVESRLKVLREKVLAPGVLTQVIRDFRLYPSLEGMPDRVDTLRRRLDIKLDGTSSVTLTFEAHDPGTAAAVVNRLAERAVRTHAQDRIARAESTVSFLKRELLAVQPELDKADDELRRYKLTHKGQLPEELDANLREMEQARLLIGRTQDVLAAARARRRSMVTESIARMRGDERELWRQVVDARARYTPQHPEVKRLEAAHAAAQKRRQEEERRLALAVQTSPEAREAEGEIAQLQAAIAALRRQVREREQRVASTPKTSEELAVLVRNFNRLHERHGHLRSRLFEAELALGLERKLQGSRAVLVDRAAVPTSPSRPNKAEMLVIAFFASLLLSLGVAVIRESLDHSVREPREVRAAFGALPVLACVPHIGRLRHLPAVSPPLLTAGSGQALTTRKG